ncbi:Inosine/uridine-preferring nucleoside hydrolase domain-containing protein [Mycena olivaceomarginata]|nr:Inosine/uridine-preferring nucleoside hydrolase domain-containing protein [Mycena olivaceomarginata]
MAPFGPRHQKRASAVCAQMTPPLKTRLGSKLGELLVGADYPLLQTPDRFQAYEALLGTLPWEGVFKWENITAEAEGGDPTSGDPGRIVRAAFEMPYYGYPNATFAEDTPAAMFMVEQVRKYPGEITIYSGGALTNIALAVRMDPTFAQNTKGLFIMGGYVDRMVQQTTGDVFQASLVSDINFVVDPEAAKIALSAAFPKITLVGNAANLLISTQEFLDEIYEVKNPYSELVHAYYGTVTDLVLGHPGIYSNLLELQHTIMYFTTLRRHLTRANAGLSS